MNLGAGGGPGGTGGSGANNLYYVQDGLGPTADYKQKYSSMKAQLKAILYENELLQDELHRLQSELLDIYRDKETLLEKIIQNNDIDWSSSSETESQSSDIGAASKIKILNNTDNNNKPQMAVIAPNIVVAPTTNPTNPTNATNATNVTTVTANQPKPAAPASTKKREANNGTSVQHIDGQPKAKTPRRNRKTSTKNASIKQTLADHPSPHPNFEQLSAEELEQHLEARRIEQTAQILADWELNLTSEILTTDSSAIKFMAED